MASKILDEFWKEIKQTPERRKPLLKQIATALNANVLLLFVSSKQMLNSANAKLIELKLSEFNEQKDLILVLNGPGGDSHAAEVIVNSCRAHTKKIKKEFRTLVVTSAMSALTIVALGSDKIIMTDSSYIGPVDPIISIPKLDSSGKPIVLPNGQLLQESFPAYSFLQKYKKLKEEFAKDKTNQAIINELSLFDPKLVQQIQQIYELSESIARKFLESGMLNGKSAADVNKVIEFFTNPEKTKSHGRPLFASDNLGLNTEIISEDNGIWQSLQLVYLSANFFAENNATTIIESSE
jgi:ClpP class serine protease